MIKIISKIPAVVALLFTFLSLFYYVKSFFDVESELWEVSVIVVLASAPFYFIDTIISMVKAIKNDDRKFNIILVVCLFGAIPVFLYLGDSGIDLYNVIWNVYYLLMTVLEIISIKKAFDYMRTHRKRTKEV